MPAKPKQPKKSQPKTPSSPLTKNAYRFTVRLIGGPFALAKGQRKPVRGGGAGASG